MKKLFYETKEFLKEKVEKIEREILALTDDGAACCVSDDKGAYLAKLIEERKDALDALFQATPNEVMRMDKLNDQLKTVTHQMHERVAIVNEDAAKIFVEGNCSTQKLHKRASALVKAEKQSQMMELLEPLLKEDELAVYKRGRNAKSYTMAKNATMSDYRRATGFEALMGYLYLTDQNMRMIDLIKIGLEIKDGREIDHAGK